MDKQNRQDKQPQYTREIQELTITLVDYT